jgi:hypothetical protein
VPCNQALLILVSLRPYRHSGRLQDLQDGRPAKRQFLGNLPTGLPCFVCLDDVGSQLVRDPGRRCGGGETNRDGRLISSALFCLSINFVFGLNRLRATSGNGPQAQARGPFSCHMGTPFTTDRGAAFTAIEVCSDA